MLSSRPYLVTGGDALVRVTVKKQGREPGQRAHRAERRTTSPGRSTPTRGARTLTGLVTGLRNGENELSVDVDAKGKGHGRADADITLTNYPIQGPIISGPHEFPFACTTATFVPLRRQPGARNAAIPNCHVATPRAVRLPDDETNTFKSLPSRTRLPADRRHDQHRRAVHRAARDGNHQSRDLPDRDPA